MAETKSPSSASAPLWRTDGARYGRSDAWASPEGGLEIAHHDLGGGEHAPWGVDDHETTLSLTPAATAALAVALLRERFGDRPDALEAIRAFCRAYDIDAALAAWT